MCQVHIFDVAGDILLRNAEKETYRRLKHAVMSIYKFYKIIIFIQFPHMYHNVLEMVDIISVLNQLVNTIKNTK